MGAIGRGWASVIPEHKFGNRQELLQPRSRHHLKNQSQPWPFLFVILLAASGQAEPQESSSNPNDFPFKSSECGDCHVGLDCFLKVNWPTQESMSSYKSIQCAGL